MTLRLRLLLAFGYLAALVLIVSISAMFTFLHLSSGIDVILTNNFRTIEASMGMIEALERIDSSTLAALLERQPPDVEDEQLVAIFLENLAKAEANVTEVNEPVILASIREKFDGFLEARAALLERSPERPLAAYESDVFPRFGAVKSELFALLEVNHDAMIAADRRAKTTAVQSGAWLGALVTIALVSFVFMAHALRSQVLQRLARLRRDMERIGSSGTLRRIHCPGHDELSAIAGTINRILDGYETHRARTEQRLARERRLVSALLYQLGEDAALFDPRGNLIAGDLGREAAEREIGRWIADRQRAELEPEVGPQEVEVGNGAVRLDLVATPQGQPLGWLARIARNA